MGMKKGFFFSTDGFVALMLFIIVLLGIYSYIIISSSMQQQYYFSEDLLDVFANVNVSELEENYPALGIYDGKMTLLEAIVSDTENSGEIIEELSSGLINEQYKIALYVDGYKVFSNLANITSLVARERLVNNNNENFNITRLEVGLRGANYTVIQAEE